MTIKAIILNVCDSFLKPKFLLKNTEIPEVEGDLGLYTAASSGFKQRLVT